MLSHLKHNAIAYTALFVALGGTSYAAVKLPKNSVGATEIKAGAVASSEIKDRSIKTTDLAAKTRAALKGQQGAAGASGAAGAAGAAGEKGDKGEKGDTGATGATGPAGPVDVVQRALTGEPISTSFNAVGALPLPEGSWLVTASVVVDNNGGKNTYVECSLWTPDGRISLTAASTVLSAVADPAISSNRLSEMTLSATTAAPSGGRSVTLLCQRTDGATGSSPVVTADVQFLGTRATTITNQ
ncbi:MAG: hypothetical protein V9E83_11760 [Baekduia sp.]